MGKQRFRGVDIKNAIGVSNSTISAWKRGVNFPDYPYRQKLADLLNVSQQYLFCGIPKKVADTNSEYLLRQGETEPSNKETTLDNSDRQSERTGVTSEGMVNIADSFWPQESQVNKSPPVIRRQATREDCETLISSWLDAAEKDPNGIPYAYKLLEKFINVRDFDQS